MELSLVLFRSFCFSCVPWCITQNILNCSARLLDNDGISAVTSLSTRSVIGLIEWEFSRGASGVGASAVAIGSEEACEHLLADHWGAAVASVLDLPVDRIRIGWTRCGSAAHPTQDRGRAGACSTTTASVSFSARLLW